MLCVKSEDVVRLFVACYAFGDLLFKRLKSRQKVARSNAARGCTAQIPLGDAWGTVSLREFGEVTGVGVMGTVRCAGWVFVMDCVDDWSR